MQHANGIRDNSIHFSCVHGTMRLVACQVITAVQIATQSATYIFARKWSMADCNLQLWFEELITSRSEMGHAHLHSVIHLCSPYGPRTFMIVLVTYELVQVTYSEIYPGYCTYLHTTMLILLHHFRPRKQTLTFRRLITTDYPWCQLKS